MRLRARYRHPLEVKAGINLKSKSLQSFDASYHPPRLLRTTLLNTRLDGRIANVPLYAVASIFNRLLSARDGWV